MNWDWDKLQEKRRHQGQQPWDFGGKGNGSQKEQRPEQPDFDLFGERDEFKKKETKEPQPGNNGNNGNKGNNGNNRNNGYNVGGQDPRELMRRFRAPGVKWVVLGIVGAWLLTGIYIVRPDEAGVVLRFGAYNRTVGSGPHYHLPAPFEQVYLPKVTQVRQAEVGFRSQSSGASFQQGRIQSVDEEAAMLTGDENIVNIQFNIQYHIKPDGAVDYLFNVTQPDAVVKKAAEAAMREVIGKTTLDAALTGGRVKIQDDVSALLQTILDRYQVGVQVVAVQMQDVQPPQEVREGFKDVASAREDKQRLTNEAEAYRRDILPKAQGLAAEIINQGEAYKRTRILSAEGETQRFLSVLAEYEKAQDITKKRMLYEALEDVLSQPGMEKMILPDGMTDKVLPFLPLGSGFTPAPAAPVPAAPSAGVPEAPSASVYPSAGSVPSNPEVSGRPDSRAERGVN